jgi:hypothetical protein
MKEWEIKISIISFYLLPIPLSFISISYFTFIVQIMPDNWINKSFKKLNKIIEYRAKGQPFLKSVPKYVILWPHCQPIKSCVKVYWNLRRGKTNDGIGIHFYPIGVNLFSTRELANQNGECVILLIFQIDWELPKAISRN